MLTIVSSIFPDESKNVFSFPRIGKICVVKCDGNWYRGRVSSVDSGWDTKVEVVLVDFGSVRRIDVSLVREIEAEFASFPPLAYRCALDGVNPNATFNSQIIQRFEKAVMDKQLIAKFTVPLNNSKYAVNLSEKMVNGFSLSINKLFMQLPETVLPFTIQFHPTLFGTQEVTQMPKLVSSVGN